MVACGGLIFFPMRSHLIRDILMSFDSCPESSEPSDANTRNFMELEKVAQEEKIERTVCQNTSKYTKMQRSASNMTKPCEDFNLRWNIEQQIYLNPIHSKAVPIRVVQLPSHAMSKSSPFLNLVREAMDLGQKHHLVMGRFRQILANAWTVSGPIRIHKDPASPGKLFPVRAPVTLLTGPQVLFSQLSALVSSNVLKWGWGTLRDALISNLNWPLSSMTPECVECFTSPDSKSPVERRMLYKNRVKMLTIRLRASFCSSVVLKQSETVGHIFAHPAECATSGASPFHSRLPLLGIFLSGKSPHNRPTVGPTCAKSLLCWRNLCSVTSSSLLRVSFSSPSEKKILDPLISPVPSVCRQWSCKVGTNRVWIKSLSPKTSSIRVAAAHLQAPVGLDVMLRLCMLVCVTLYCSIGLPRLPRFGTETCSNISNSRHAKHLRTWWWVFSTSRRCRAAPVVFLTQQSSSWFSGFVLVKFGEHAKREGHIGHVTKYGQVLTSFNQAGNTVELRFCCNCCVSFLALWAFLPGPPTCAVFFTWLTHLAHHDSNPSNLKSSVMGN